ncbi:MAG TPA: hypothetical protein VFY05_14490 [Candidatus Angelobacter sp.]|nr:hypothetical protein [Candidatus Angelobacter sp.]
MLKDQRSMVIAVTPAQAAELKSILSEGPESIRRKLASPPSLRGSGWDLPTSAHVELLRGELIRTFERGRMIVDLYRDGTLIVEGQIHRNFLAWSDKEDLQLHPLALIEWVLNIMRFYQVVLEDFRTPPNELQVRVELRNMHLAGRSTMLGAGPVHTFAPLGEGQRGAPADSWVKDHRFEVSSYDPEKTAFALIREIYAWFGYSEEQIPYTKNTPEGKAIDSNNIANLR